MFKLDLRTQKITCLVLPLKFPYADDDTEQQLDWGKIPFGQEAKSLPQQKNVDNELHKFISPPSKLFHIKPLFSSLRHQNALHHYICSFDILHQVNFLISNLAFLKAYKKHASPLFTSQQQAVSPQENLRANLHQASEQVLEQIIKSYLPTLSYEFWNGIFMLGQSQFLEMVVSQHFSFCTKKEWGLN